MTFVTPPTGQPLLLTVAQGCLTLLLPSTSAAFWGVRKPYKVTAQQWGTTAQHKLFTENSYFCRKHSVCLQTSFGDNVFLFPILTKTRAHLSTAATKPRGTNVCLLKQHIHVAKSNSHLFQQPNPLKLVPHCPLRVIASSQGPEPWLGSPGIFPLLYGCAWAGGPVAAKLCSFNSTPGKNSPRKSKGQLSFHQHQAGSIQTWVRHPGAPYIFKLIFIG